jgi:deoxyribonuclease-4
MAASSVRRVVSHDSYLINLASPLKRMRNLSIRCFKGELLRCQALGIPHVVTHPGNFLDDRDAGLARNAEAYGACLESVPGPSILLEATAGTGTALGSTFEELAALRDAIPAGVRHRVAFCADTCHLYAANYDLVGNYEGVWEHWDRVIGLEHLQCLHLNDSKTAMGARRDRHEWIAEGTLGAEPFRRIMRDARFAGIMKVIETPKGDDAVRYDRKMLRRLRRYRDGSAGQ